MPKLYSLSIGLFLFAVGCYEDPATAALSRKQDLEIKRQKRERAKQERENEREWERRFEQRQRDRVD